MANDSAGPKMNINLSFKLQHKLTMTPRIRKKIEQEEIDRCLVIPKAGPHRGPNSILWESSHGISVK